ANAQPAIPDWPQRKPPPIRLSGSLRNAVPATKSPPAENSLPHTPIGLAHRALPSAESETFSSPPTSSSPALDCKSAAPLPSARPFAARYRRIRSIKPRSKFFVPASTPVLFQAAPKSPPSPHSQPANVPP